ncbi:MAG: DUF4345 domain-containing protein [Zhongshania sp.]|uniref:DUF4345 domain-containing protein n=1 Tax=Zhongshania sp. TaxID=1971902 RepID=UPI0026311492|nr:DUF4345 domain-containing protein [Zhongshania sp.]MDF1693153.1 DUF4345 domain-containing protein [Zhongshania sp.]
MKFFKFVVAIWALLPLLTGLMDILVGPSAWRGIGLGINDLALADSVLDSQIRFVGTIWFAYGVLLLVCLKDVKKYATILNGALFVVFLGGIARVLSIFMVGFPASSVGSGFIIIALLIELFLMPGLMFWFYYIRKFSKVTSW